MSTFSMGFRYNEGKKVGYDISCPGAFGGETLLVNVSYRDKGRIVQEMKDLGHTHEEIKVQRVE